MVDYTVTNQTSTPVSVQAWWLADASIYDVADTHDLGPAPDGAAGSFSLPFAFYATVTVYATATWPDGKVTTNASWAIPVADCGAPTSPPTMSSNRPRPPRPPRSTRAATGTGAATGAGTATRRPSSSAKRPQPERPWPLRTASPSRRVGAVAAGCEPRASLQPCHPRAISSGYERYVTVSHGHFDSAGRVGIGL